MNRDKFKYTSIFPNNHWGKVIMKMVRGEEFEEISFFTNRTLFHGCPNLIFLCFNSWLYLVKVGSKNFGIFQKKMLEFFVSEKSCLDRNMLFWSYGGKKLLYTPIG